jgi:hypothetical protein
LLPAYVADRYQADEEALSSTGIWRNFPVVMRFKMLLTVSFTPQ